MIANHHSFLMIMSLGRMPSDSGFKSESRGMSGKHGGKIKREDI